MSGLSRTSVLPSSSSCRPCYVNSLEHGGARRRHIGKREDPGDEVGDEELWSSCGLSIQATQSEREPQVDLVLIQTSLLLLLLTEIML